MNADLLRWAAATAGFLGGFWLLVRSADWFVEGAASLAARLRVPPLIIGFVVVGFGTSAPEMLVSALAAAQGMPVLALGNALGSNITNILLILGASMLVAPIALHRVALRRDIPFLFLLSLLFTAFAWDGALGRWEGSVPALLFLAFLGWQIRETMRRKAPVSDETPDLPLGRALFLTLGGLLALLAASQVLVSAAQFMARRIAEAAGLSPEATHLIIGVTVVALGTSLPELMASVTAMRKGEHDIALGNVIGSNCFNLGIVAAIALLIRPVADGALPRALQCRDAFVMNGATLLLWALGLAAWLRCHGKKRPITLGRAWGVLFLALWLAYTLRVFLHTRT